jgi:hypothetical protein
MVKNDVTYNMATQFANPGEKFSFKLITVATQKRDSRGGFVFLSAISVLSPYWAGFGLIAMQQGSPNRIKLQAPRSTVNRPD